VYRPTQVLRPRGRTLWGLTPYASGGPDLDYVLNTNDRGTTIARGGKLLRTSNLKGKKPVGSKRTYGGNIVDRIRR